MSLIATERDKLDLEKSDREAMFIDERVDLEACLTSRHEALSSQWEQEKAVLRNELAAAKGRGDDLQD